MSTSLYAARRARVAAQLGAGGIAVIPTAPERSRNRGDLYGESGQIQHFENRYGPSGEYLGGRTEHEDGTVTEE